jgi:Tfp pilus assembly protein FimT
MVELVIVIMVMSILAAVAAPAFIESMRHHRVESAARRLKADLELTRNTARLTSSPQSLTFSGSGYYLSAAVAGLDDSNATYTVNLSAAPYEISNMTVNFNSTSTVFFDGYGTPSSGGTVVFTSGGHQCTVTLDGVTSEVSITSDHDPAPGNIANVGVLPNQGS